MNDHNQVETIDETIDRVAAQLTMVPADPALAGRIADRLERSTFNLWRRLYVATAVVAAVAIAAVVVSNGPRETRGVDVARVTSPDSSLRIKPPTTVTPAASPAMAAVSVAPERAVRQRRGSAVAHEPLPEMPQIDPLASPALLAVETLRSDTLTITPVDLVPLGLANLSMTEIDGRDSPKE